MGSARQYPSRRNGSARRSNPVARPHSQSRYSPMPRQPGFGFCPRCRDRRRTGMRFFQRALRRMLHATV
ncbi:MAG: hypothetical protein AB7O44_13505 [Hyphomicrobiaceae bacterium]